MGVYSANAEGDRIEPDEYMRDQEGEGLGALDSRDVASQTCANSGISSCIPVPPRSALLLNVERTPALPGSKAIIEDHYTFSTSQRNRIMRNISICCELMPSSDANRRILCQTQ